MHHNQVGFISGMQSWFIIPKLFTELHYINKLRSEKYMIISDAEKASSWQKPNKLEIKRSSSTWKAIYTKKIPTVSIILNSEKPNAFPLQNETRMSTLTSSI